MDGGKRASVRNIIISVLLIVVGIAMLMLVTEGIKSGWYDAHSARPAKRKGYAALLPVLLVLLGLSLIHICTLRQADRRMSSAR